MKIKCVQIFLVMALMTSCAGYRFQDKTNPFSQYDIRSISVPMFYNQSNFSNVSGVFTKEIYKTLLDFKNLDLFSGNQTADAVLIGIISSEDKKQKSLEVIASKRVKNTFGSDVIGEKREDFVVSSVSKARLSLRIIVIKHPTKKEIEFFQTQISEHVVSSKVIFNERIALSGNVNSRELQGDAISVLGTQNRGARKQALERIAQSAAGSFKHMILYAF